MPTSQRTHNLYEDFNIYRVSIKRSAGLSTPLRSNSSRQIFRIDVYTLLKKTKRCISNAVCECSVLPLFYHIECPSPRFRVMLCHCDSAMHTFDGLFVACLVLSVPQLPPPKPCKASKAVESPVFPPVLSDWAYRRVHKRIKQKRRGKRVQ